ncbi:hypothetical protein KEM55_009264, partial [Ascosphaera atra]
MGPYLSWAVILALAGVVAWYYTKDTQHRHGKHHHTTAATVTTTTSATTTAADQASKKSKRRNKKAATAATKPQQQPQQAVKMTKSTTVAVEEQSDSDEPDQEISNREFAAQLSKARTGAPLTTGSDSKKTQKSKAPAPSLK